MGASYYKELGDPLFDRIVEANKALKPYLEEAKEHISSVYGGTFTQFVEGLSYDEYSTVAYWESVSDERKTPQQAVDDLFYEDNQILRQRKFAGNFY